MYPLPHIEDLLASLSGGKSSTKLDLSYAYPRVHLEEASRQYITVNTDRGLLRYQRLPVGVAPAPAIFQQLMEMLLQGLPGVLALIASNFDSLTLIHHSLSSPKCYVTSYCQIHIFCTLHSALISQSLELFHNITHTLNNHIVQCCSVSTKLNLHLIANGY